MAVAVAAFVEALEQLPLLEPAQRAQLATLKQQFPELEGLAQELLRRGWLTTFQVNQLAAGKGAHLVLDQYVLLALLGEGGMGAVYTARQRRMQRLVAVKVIRREALKAASAVERFQREAVAAASLAHANIVTVFDSNEVNGTHFLVMEFIEGTDLAKLVELQGPLSVAEACDYIRQAALGLQHAHERGLVHRDIKPHNLMRSVDGVVKVMDLGLARTAQAARETAESQKLTGTGVMMGTADYLAPEQAQDARSVDIRADIYSLGCTLYHLLAGEPPFEGGTLANKVAAHMFKEPDPLDTRRTDAPAEVAAVVRRMMAKKPEERYQTPAEVAQALEPFGLGNNHAPPATRLLPPEEMPPIAPGKTISYQGLPVAQPVPFSGAPEAAPPQRHRRVVLALLTVAVLVGGWFLFKGLFSRARNDPSAAIGTTVAPASLTLELGKGNGLDLVLIRKGTFLMGSIDSDIYAGPEEKPRHTVEISKDFYLGKYDVTRGQFAQFLKDAGQRSEAEEDGLGCGGYNEATKEQEAYRPQYSWRHTGFLQTDDHPVVNVTWNDAQAFCAWLSQKSGKRIELPTEAQWEYACRAGTRTNYFTGDAATSLKGFANVADQTFKAKGIKGSENWIYFGFTDGYAFTAPVGSFKPNPAGLYDITGNVWQWCADGKRIYSTHQCSGPRGPDDDGTRVVRGGSWHDHLWTCRCAARIVNPVSIRMTNLGFRVAVRLD